MAQIIYHQASSRGAANHGWLKSYHSFSFATYYNPERIHFGVLRVLNDDWVAPGMGFGTHPHQNMEIISIPLSGALKHQDSMGNVALIKAGDVQVMSAGTGVSHSEFNASSQDPVQFLQIWVIPSKENVKPRYDQISLSPGGPKNTLMEVVSPKPTEGSVWINQDAWFHLGTFEKKNHSEYLFKGSDSGVYAFVLEGSFQCEGQTLNRRDGLGIWDTKSIHFEALADNSSLLLMEVPMKLPD